MQTHSQDARDPGPVLSDGPAGTEKADGGATEASSDGQRAAVDPANAADQASNTGGGPGADVVVPPGNARDLEGRGSIVDRGLPVSANPDVAAAAPAGDEDRPILRGARR